MNIRELLECITEADKNPARYDKSILTGLSGEKIISLLRTFAGKILDNEKIYLEVGVFQGLTLLSIAETVPDFEVFGIDNFAFFDKDSKNLNIVNERMRKLKIKNAKIINEDFEDALENLNNFIGIKKIGLYFIDGPHDYRSQLMCLLLAKPYLADNAIIIVDDCNYRHVRQANRDFLLTNRDYKLIFQSYTKAHPSNLKGDARREVEAGWWNGINVILKDSKNQFEPFFPPTIRERILFENDHYIHSVRYPEAIKKYSGLINLIASFAGHKKFRNDFIGSYKSLNTFSYNLTYDNYNMSFFIDHSKNN